VVRGADEAWAWLADPGAVPVGATFRTVLYLDPAVGDTVSQPVVEMVFDPRTVYCAALEPPPAEDPPVSCDVTIAIGRVTARIALRDALAAAGGGPRIAVATVKWRCVGEGETRVETRVLLPTAPPPSVLRVVQRPRG